MKIGSVTYIVSDGIEWFIAGKKSWPLAAGLSSGKYELEIWRWLHRQASSMQTQATCKIVSARHDANHEDIVIITVDQLKDYGHPLKKAIVKEATRKKYHAALLCLTDHSVVDIAVLSDNSYGVLRKWRSQEEFKKIVETERNLLVSILYEMRVSHYM